MADLAMRASDLRAFYTDAGAYPRAALDRLCPSLHALGGSLEYEAFLFVVAGFLALLFTLGYRTSLVAAMSWVMLFSLRLRNDIILNSGDKLMLALLFWAILLPVGARWSLDAWRSKGPPHSSEHTCTSPAVAGLYLQAVMVYVMSAFSKLGNPLWRQGEAVAMTLTNAPLVSAAGVWLQQFSHLLVIITYATLVLEVAGALLLLSPFRTSFFRSVLPPLFWSFHLAISIFMRVGLFPFVSIVSTICFLPSATWRSWIQEEEPFKGPPHVQPSKTARSRFIHVTAVLGIIYMGWSTLNATSVIDLPPQWLHVLEEKAHFRQRWTMFHKAHPRSLWFVYAAELRNGERLDIHSGQRQDLFAPPRYESTRFKNMRWRRYLSEVRRTRGKHLRDYLGRYVWNDWNQKHSAEEQLASLEIYALSMKNDEVESVAIWSRKEDHATRKDNAHE